MKGVIRYLLFFILSLKTARSQPVSIVRPDGITISTSEIDKKVSQLMNAGGVTGLSLAILQHNQPAYVQAYGFRNKTKRLYNDTATIFYAASFSKAVFAYLVMQLVDEKKIELDRPLSQYLPKPLPEYVDFKDLASDKRWTQITARHCLSHSTGFPNWRWANPRGNDKLEIFFRPGERYAYSGEGIQLLQLVVETIMGRSLESLMQERVFKPLGMRRSSFLWRLAFEKNYALPYNEDEKVLPKDKRSKAYAAGSMETTIADYSRFIAAVMNGKGISKQALQDMLSMQVPIHSRHQFPSLSTDTTGVYQSISLSYGLGWGLLNGSYGVSFFKEGHGEGFENYNINFPGRRFAVIVMTNSANGESIFPELVTALAGEASIPWDWEGYTPYKDSRVLPDSLLRTFAGIYQSQDSRATISIEDGTLMIECIQRDIPRTGLYATSDMSFFARSIELEVTFIKNSWKRVIGLKIGKGSDAYEMKKIK